MARTNLRRPVLLAGFAISGAAALAYEVVWTRALSIVLGSTTHALSSMLATFMLGLAIGGLLGGRAADRTKRPLVWLAACELGIGLLGIVSALLIRAMPAAYLAMYRSLHLAPAPFYAVQIGLCSLVMLGPTALMGMTFPLVARATVDSFGEVGSAVGVAYAANTFGAVAGSLLAGFVLVPVLGLRGTTFTAASANLAIGALFAFGGGNLRVVALGLVYLPFLGAAASGEWSFRLVNFYTMHRYIEGPSYEVLHASDRRSQERLYEHDGPDGYVAAYRGEDGHLIMQVGGKLEGTASRDVPNTLMLAYLPVAAHPAPRSMLVIGLGAGVTLDAAKRAVSDVELAEINADVIEAVRRHGPSGVLDGVTIHRADARNLLLRSEARYDVISSEPSYPTDFPVANLFTREFFELASRRLAPRGVFCQWLPYYMLTNDDVTMMVKTFASAFPHASLWKVQGSLDLLLLGSVAPFAKETDAIMRRVAELSPALTREVVLSRSPAQVADLARREDVPVNTDDRPILEFRVARNFRVGDLSVLER